MENQLFQLKLTSKQLARESKKSEKAAKSNQEKCKKAMEKQNMDGARIYAESAIREKNQALNYLRLSNRIDAVAQRVNTAIKMNTLTASMKGVVKGMDIALESMNVEKISNVMDKFEKQFEDLDVSSKVMESSMSTSTAQSMPIGQVDALMQQVADEHGLEFESQLDGVGVGAKKLNAGEAKANKVKAPKQVVAAGAVPAPAAGAPASAPAAAPAAAAPPSAAAADHKDNKHGGNGNDSNDPNGAGNNGGGGGGGGGEGGVAIKASEGLGAAKKKKVVAVAMSAGPAAVEVEAPAHPASAADEEASLEARLKALQG